jgi:hypothetical protein
LISWLATIDALTGLDSSQLGPTGYLPQQHLANSIFSHRKLPKTAVEIANRLKRILEVEREPFQLFLGYSATSSGDRHGVSSLAFGHS